MYLPYACQENWQFHVLYTKYNTRQTAGLNYILNSYEKIQNKLIMSDFRFC